MLMGSCILGALSDLEDDSSRGSGMGSSPKAWWFDVLWDVLEFGMLTQ